VALRADGKVARTGIDREYSWESEQEVGGAKAEGNKEGLSIGITSFGKNSRRVEGND
jgi:hypothetical protein